MSFSVSPRGIEDLCFAHNDLLLVLDEEGRIPNGLTASKSTLSELAYAIPSGRGKVRSNWATRDDDLKNLTWRLIAISNGENPLDDPGRRREEGEQVRMIPIPVPPGREGGIFNRIGGSAVEVAGDAAETAATLEKTISSHYGVAYPRFIKRLIAERKTARSVARKTIAKFIKQVGADNDAWNRRFATKFGIVLASALLGIQFGVIPSTKKRARLAVEEIYRRARAAVSSNAEVEAALVAKLRQISREKDKLPYLKKGQTISASRRRRAIGVIRHKKPYGKVALIRLSDLEEAVLPGASKTEILQRLADRGVIIKPKDGKLTCQVMINGFSDKKRRYVCFDVAKLNSGEV